MIFLIWVIQWYKNECILKFLMDLMVRVTIEILFQYFFGIGCYFFLQFFIFLLQCCTWFYCIQVNNESVKVKLLVQWNKTIEAETNLVDIIFNCKGSVKDAQTFKSIHSLGSFFKAIKKLKSTIFSFTDTTVR